VLFYPFFLKPTPQVLSSSVIPMFQAPQPTQFGLTVVDHRTPIRTPHMSSPYT
jgi:hypothetical protein